MSPKIESVNVFTETDCIVFDDVENVVEVEEIAKCFGESHGETFDIKINYEYEP